MYTEDLKAKLLLYYNKVRGAFPVQRKTADVSV